MWELDHKDFENWKIDAFEPWCWRILLRVPWTARRSNQSILEETSPSLPPEGLMLKLKLQSFSHLMWRADSLEKTLMLGKTEGRRRRGRQRMRRLDSTTDSMDGSLSKLWEMVKAGRPGVLQSVGSQSWIWLSDWTTNTSPWKSEVPLISDPVAWTGQHLLTRRRPGFGLWVGKTPCRRKWQPTAVFLPGKSHGQKSLVGYDPWGHKELDTTEQLHFT